MMASSSTAATGLYTHPTEGWTLRGDAAASYLRMRAAGMPAGGVAVFHRTLAKQAELRRRYEMGIGPIAARPNARAPHVLGVAMDVTTTVGGSYKPSTAHQWLTKGGVGSAKPQAGEKLQSHAYGWYRTVPSERWHFGYNPARDTKRKAGLAAKLKTLGYKNVKAFQSAAGLKVDGVDGPLTWTGLLKAKARPPVVVPTKPTAPTPAPALKDVDFRFGQVNLEAERFGGGDDATDTRGDWLADAMRCSVYCLAEVSEVARNHLRAAIPGGSNRWRIYPQGMAAVLFDSTKWRAAGRDSVTFGQGDNGIHGAVRGRLINLANGQPLDVIAVHVRPGVIATLDDKRADVRKALTLVRAGVPTIIAGDWNTKHAAEIVVAAGIKRAHDLLDSSDTPGNQPIDATFVRGLPVRGASQVNPGKISDHLAWVVNLTLSAPGSIL